MGGHSADERQAHVWEERRREEEKRRETEGAGGEKGEQQSVVSLGHTGQSSQAQCALKAVTDHTPMNMITDKMIDKNKPAHGRTASLPNRWTGSWTSDPR